MAAVGLRGPCEHVERTAQLRSAVRAPFGRWPREGRAGRRPLGGGLRGLSGAGRRLGGFSLAPFDAARRGGCGGRAGQLRRAKGRRREGADGGREKEGELVTTSPVRDYDRDRDWLRLVEI